MNHIVDALTDAVASAVKDERVEEGEATIFASVLVRVLDEDLVNALDAAIMRHRLGDNTAS